MPQSPGLRSPPHRNGEGGQANRPAAELVSERFNGAVGDQAARICLMHVQGGRGITRVDTFPRSQGWCARTRRSRGLPDAGRLQERPQLSVSSGNLHVREAGATAL